MRLRTRTGWYIALGLFFLFCIYANCSDAKSPKKVDDLLITNEKGETSGTLYFNNHLNNWQIVNSGNLIIDNRSSRVESSKPFYRHITLYVTAGDTLDVQIIASPRY